LEVAVGTGLNLPHYSAEVELTGIDLSPEMLELAVRRTEDLGRRAELKVGDAQELPFPDAYFDTVLCTFSLCNIPDVRRSISEMKRVLKPGGRMILVDHIGSSVRPIFWLQRFIEFFSKRIEGEHLTRRPAIAVREAGFSFKENELSHAGIIERLVAEKP
jgi:ubiquinone/menaquinone biosynthesis C-methylase UbiE